MTGEDCTLCGRGDGFHQWWCQHRPATDITVCEDCGHVIDVERVTVGGKRYAVSMCQRMECIDARLVAASEAALEAGREARQEAWAAEARIAARRQILWGLNVPPVVNDPRAFLRGPWV